jgi:hypothetical protein
VTNNGLLWLIAFLLAALILILLFHNGVLR